MYLELLRGENVRHLEPAEHDFRDGQGALRKWTMLEATEASEALLRCAGLTTLGRRQMPFLAGRVFKELAAQPDRPAQLEFMLVRHAPQERAPQERAPQMPVRRHAGWQFWTDGRVTPLAGSARHWPGSGAAIGLPDLGRSHRGRLVVGYGRQIIPHVGTDRFDIYPDQRVRRCGGLFDASARVTDPLAFLLRLRHKGCYRAGRARELLARLSEDLSAWLGWDVDGLLARPDELTKRWHALPARRRTPAVVLLDLARHVYDAAERDQQWGRI